MAIYEKIRLAIGANKLDPTQIIKQMALTLVIFINQVSIVFALNKNEAPPDFTLLSQNKKTITLSDYRGKIVYLDFWASWCGPCRHTLPWMERLQNKFKSQGLEVVAVNLDTNQGDAEKLLTDLKPTFTILFDPSGKVASTYQLPSMPSSFIITRDGKISEIHSGFHEGDDLIIESQIDKLLNTKR